MGRITHPLWSPLLLPCLLLLGSPSQGADAPAGPGKTIPKLFGTFTPKEGVWAEYSLTEKDTGKKSKMRMSVVGQEGDSWWYEVVNEEGDSRNVIKMLVKGNPSEPENIQRQIIKSGDNPAVEMARDFVVMGRKMAALMFERRSGVPAVGGDAARVEEVGEREVVTPAGTFKVKQQKIVAGDGKVLATYGYNADVLPFNVVTSDTENTMMELLAHGNGAKSLITEDPVPMTSPRGMPAGLPRGMPPGLERPGPGVGKPSE